MSAEQTQRRITKLENEILDNKSRIKTLQSRNDRIIEEMIQVIKESDAYQTSLAELQNSNYNL